MPPPDVIVANHRISRDYAEPRRWSADSRRVFFVATTPDSTPQNQKQAFYSISRIGGDPAFIVGIPNDANAADFSPDIRQAAVFWGEPVTF
jgi:hypothetical protein